MPKMPPDKNSPYLSACLVWQRYSVSDMTLWRWLHDDKLDFPKPIYIGRNRYWRVGDLIEWERSLAAKVA